MGRTDVKSGVASVVCYPHVGTRTWIQWVRDQSMFIFVAGVSTAFAVSLVFYLHGRLSSIEKIPTIFAFVFFKAAVEVWCSLYVGYFIFISLYFLATVGKNNSASKVASPYSDCPSLAIVYLCCEDIDQDCLESLCRTKTLGVRFSDQLYMKWFKLLSDCGQKVPKKKMAKKS